ncbi:MAG: PAS domain S-box protein, partial [Methanospirillum sp.]|uniref:PAS domain S-box protein n=1 Tax=Methanospirillum sp. TaxID=45200 RepID=UPI00236B02ED
MLYVDDEQMLLDICKIFLERTGDLRVQTESSVRKALDRISSETFDVIVSDFQMPEMDGIEFLKKIRASNNTTPFIIFTGRGREDVAIAALREGADFYLQKGGDPTSQFAELSNQVRQLVRQRRAEAAVRENEQKYHALFEYALDAIVLLDNNLIVECNPQMARLFGIPRERLLGCSLSDLSPPYQEDGSSTNETLLHRLSVALSGESQFFEWKYQRSDGFLFDCDIALTRILVNDVYLLLAVMRDITARKGNEAEIRRKTEELAASYEELLSTEEELQAQNRTITSNEQALRDSEAKLNAIIQGSPIPQFVIDTDHRVIHWNNAVAIYTGITASEMIGTDQHWRAFYPEKRPVMADLLLDGAADHLQEWYGDIYARSPLVSDAYTGIDFFPNLGEDGIWLSFTATLIRNDSGRVIGALETLEDITSQKKAMLALAESESRYRGVIENLQDIFYRSDLKGNLIMISPSALPLLGYDSMGDLLGKNISSDFYKHPDERKFFVSAVFSTGSVTNFVVTLKKRDGTPVPVSTNSHIYYDADGKPAGIEGTFRDISAQLAIEARIRRSEAILAAVVGESPVPLFVIDSNHRVIHWNKAIEQYSGIPASDIIGTDQHWRAFYQTERPCLVDLLVENNIADIPRWYEGKFAPSRLIDGAYEVVDFFPDIGKDGYWLYFTAAPIRDGDGKVIGAVEVLQDVTEQKRAEEEIQTLTRFQESIIMNANVWLMVLDEQGRILIWNHAAEEITGYLESEVSGQSWIWKVIYPDSEYRKNLTSGISRIIGENRYLQDFHTTILTKSGDKKEILWNTRLLRDPSGSRRYVAIGIDISARICAEQALLESKNTLNAIVKGSPISQFVIDKNHLVIQWNKALERYSGIPADTVVGTDQHWRAFYSEKRPCIADMVVDNADVTSESRYPEHYERSDLVDGGYQAVDFFPMMGAGGSWLFFTAAPIRDEHGTVIGAVETLEDITERKIAEHALMESEERFRTLFNNANDAIFLHRLSDEGIPGFFIEMNETACNILGYTREELLSMTPMDIVPELTKEADLNNSKILLSRGHVTFETLYLTLDKKEIPVEINASVYEFKGERMVLSNVRDISERKRYESAITNANNKLNLLSNITRHDILNQLTALSGYLEISEDLTDS